MCDIRYFKRALSLYKTAVREYQTGQADEYTMNTVAYSLQQVVELVLNAILNLWVSPCHQLTIFPNWCECARTMVPALQSPNGLMTTQKN